MFDVGTIRYYRDFDKYDFYQASIYVDACLVLALNDLPTPDFTGTVDFADELALLDDLFFWMKHSGAEKLVISNHVYGEVVHTLFKNTIYRTLELAIKAETEELEEDEREEIGDRSIAIFLLRTLRSMGRNTGIDLISKLKNGHSIDIGKLMKEAKAQSGSGRNDHGNRQKLAEYYEIADLRYEILIKTIQGRYELPIEVVPSDIYVQDHARRFMTQFQLESTDALHLAVAKHHGVRYFMTKDGDYDHELYDGSLGSTQILKITS